MAQVKLPKKMYVKIGTYLKTVQGDKDPLVVISSFVMDGITIIQRMDADSFTPMKEVLSGSVPGYSDTLHYAKIDDLGAIFNKMRYDYKLETRRHLLYEALIAFSMSKNLMKLEKGKFIF